MRGKFLLLTVGVLAALLVAELALRIEGVLNPPGRFVYPPQHTYYFSPDSSILWGIKGEKQFRTNAQGFRGNADFTDTTYNVLCVGGSTTECNYLDNNETWYSILERQSAIAAYLHVGDRRIVMASVGLSGQTSLENYFMLKELLGQNKNIHCVIWMCGINDFLKVLAKPGLNLSITKRNDEFSKEHAIARYWFTPGRINDTTWTAHSALLHALRVHFFTEKTKNSIDRKGNIIQQWRRNYASRSAYLDSLPNLEIPLVQFQQNIEQMIILCSSHHIPLVAINQATIWHDSLSQPLQSLLWMGGVGNYQTEPHGIYYTPKALQQGIDSYNAAFQQIAIKNEVPFIDIASVLPKDTSVFYDDCHFNESGAKKVAAEVAFQLKSVRP